MAKDNWNSVSWHDGRKTQPVSTQGEAGSRPIISDEVLVYFEGVGFDVAVYDHERRAWLLPNSDFEEPDALPTYWKPLPSLPTDDVKRLRGQRGLSIKPSALRSGSESPRSES